MSDEEKHEREIELFQQKRSFLIQVTNKMLLGLLGSTIVICATVSYWFGGFVSEHHEDHRMIIEHTGQIRDIGKQLNTLTTIKNSK